MGEAGSKEKKAYGAKQGEAKNAKWVKQRTQTGRSKERKWAKQRTFVLAVTSMKNEPMKTARGSTSPDSCRAQRVSGAAKTQTKLKASAPER